MEVSTKARRKKINRMDMDRSLLLMVRFIRGVLKMGFRTDLGSSSGMTGPDITVTSTRDNLPGLLRSLGARLIRKGKSCKILLSSTENSPMV